MLLAIYANIFYKISDVFCYGIYHITNYPSPCSRV